MYRYTANSKLIVDHLKVDEIVDCTSYSTCQVMLLFKVTVFNLPSHVAI